MADDAGALLVRSGLVSSSALDDARARVADAGGTLGEQLVATGVIGDDKLTEFYRQRLLVPQVNPNSLARLPAKIVALIPSEMALELRAIPVSLDGDNNLTVAMSDPSDRHAVDEIAFFTGTYVVRAVATQMQIAWCLAHYYGHVTDLGVRLLEEGPQPGRAKSITEQVRAARTKRLERGEVHVDPAELQRRVAQPQTGAKGRAPSREASGEIRVPSRRAPSIRPPLPEESGEIVIEAQAPEPSGPVIIIDAQPAIDSGPISVIPASRDSGPVITVEISEEAIQKGLGEITAKTTPAPPAKAPAQPALTPVPKRKRPAEPDPPELAARAGEVQLATGESIKKIDFEEPSIMISDELERALHAGSQVSGELASREHTEPEHDPLDDNSTVVVREEITNEVSEPVLLDRRRPSDPPTTFRSAAPNVEIDDGPSDVVVLETKKQPVKRVPHDTKVGIGVVTAVTRARASEPPRDVHNDPTRFSTVAAPPGDYTSGSDDLLAAPPSPYGPDDTEPVSNAQPKPLRHPGPSGQVLLDGVQRAPSHLDEDDDDQKSRPTLVMSAVELDELVPGRSSEVVPGYIDQGGDDGWGPPGSTIPPSLLGAIPISDSSGVIPIPDVDTAPLLIAPPRPPTSGSALMGNDGGVARALEEATAGVLELIRTLDHTSERDQVIAVLIAHLAQSHKRAGFFAVRGGELTLFAVMPRQPRIHEAALRLDRPSTLQDVVGTRLPYRGPMLDEASRSFVATTLGAAPPELLLVPIAVRERVVGVLFGEHRVKHTFDDQLALAARAAGMALERILKAKRG